MKNGRACADQRILIQHNAVQRNAAPPDALRRTTAVIDFPQFDLSADRQFTRRSTAASVEIDVRGSVTLTHSTSGKMARIDQIKALISDVRQVTVSVAATHCCQN